MRIDVLLLHLTSEISKVVYVFNARGLTGTYEIDIYDCEDEESPGNIVLHKRLVPVFEACLNTFTSVDAALVKNKLPLT